jgi:hypothetical protein
VTLKTDDRRQDESALRQAGGWKLDRFRYDSKLTRGKKAVRTHSL